MYKPESRHLSWLAFAEELERVVTIPEVRDRVNAFDGELVATFRGYDRWLLTSNLHKAVRYGLPKVAAATAQALWTLDPWYFSTRIRVIALEDVGIGNLGACCEAIILSAHQGLQAHLRPRPWPAYLGARLAATIKSRASCDILSYATAAIGGLELADRIRSTAVPLAVEIACDRSMTLLERAVALLSLEYGPRDVGRQRRDAIDVIGTRLDLPPVLQFVMQYGRNTHGLNVLSALAFELAAAESLLVRTVDQSQLPVHSSGGFLLAALDQHTRLGKRAIRDWARAPDLVEMQRQLRSGSDRLAVLGMALFQVEGSVLNKSLTNSALDGLRRDSEREELTALGVRAAQVSPLTEAVRTCQDALIKARRHHLTSTFGDHAF